MATTKDDIRTWLDHGKTLGATHMIVVCDTHDYEDFPAYIFEGENARDKHATYDGRDGQRVMEVYSYRLDLEAQLCEHRANHLD